MPGPAERDSRGECVVDQQSQLLRCYGAPLGSDGGSRRAQSRQLETDTPACLGKAPRAVLQRHHASPPPARSGRDVHGPRSVCRVGRTGAEAWDATVRATLPAVPGGDALSGRFPARAGRRPCGPSALQAVLEQPGLPRLLVGHHARHVRDLSAGRTPIRSGAAHADDRRDLQGARLHLFLRHCQARGRRSGINVDRAGKAAKCCTNWSPRCPQQRHARRTA